MNPFCKSCGFSAVGCKDRAGGGVGRFPEQVEECYGSAAVCMFQTKGMFDQLGSVKTEVLIRLFLEALQFLEIYVLTTCIPDMLRVGR